MERENFAVRLSHKIAVVGSIGVIGLLVVAATYITDERRAGPMTRPDFRTLTDHPGVAPSSHRSLVAESPN